MQGRIHIELALYTLEGGGDARSPIITLWVVREL